MRRPTFLLKLSVFTLYAAFVGYVSLLPGDAVSINIWDKLAHFLVYGLFSILGYGVSRSSRSYWVLCLLIIIYSGLLEMGQSFIPGRMMSANDLLANGLGVFTGAVVIRLLTVLRVGRH